MRALQFAAATTLLLVAAVRAQQPAGPVVALPVVAAEVWSVSAGGGVHPPGRPAVSLPFRASGAAVADGALWVVGGEPGVSGSLVRVAAQPGTPRRIAGDLLYDVAVAADGRLALAAADGRALVLHSAGAEPLAVHRHAGVCRAVAFSPDGAALVSVGLDGIVWLSRGDGSPRALADHTAGIDCVAFAADGAELASGARDGRVRVHAADGRLLRTVQRLGSAVLALAYDRGQGTFVAGTRDGAVFRLAADRAEAEPLATLGEPVHALAVVAGAVHVGLTGRVVTIAASR